ncbi:MAG: hypothetical protein IPG91_05535 [Ideonella sp.]|nr:hypothetical protein [Ideonella sp.]
MKTRRPCGSRCKLPVDSQFRLHSPFADNQAFTDFVVQQARLMAPQLPVLVKRHPMDGAHYRLPPARWVGGNLSRLYGPGLLVVCINSTVGFEAAARGVPVICFGPSSTPPAPRSRSRSAATLRNCWPSASVHRSM